MGQRIFFSYKDDDSTFDLDRRTLGILDSGLYRGFDADLTIAGMNLNLIHTPTGGIESDINLNLTSKFGIVITKQGAIVRDDTTIVLAITPNHTTHPRIDTIYLEHQYLQIAGGAAASYSVRTGTAASSPFAPALPFPNKQVVLGYLYVPAGLGFGSDMTNPAVVYTKAPTPFFANDPTIMRTNVVQISTAHKTLSSWAGIFKTANVVAGGINSTKVIDLQNVTSNFYEIANTSAGLLVVTDIINNTIVNNGGVANSQVIYFSTQQALEIIASPTLQCIGNRYIKAGQCFCAVSVAGNTTAPSGINWVIFSGGEAIKGDYNKFKALQAFEKSVLKSLGSSHELNLQNKSNYILIGTLGGSLLGSISSAYNPEDTSIPVNIEGGTRLVIAFSKNYTVLHNDPAAPASPYKKIISPTGADFNVSNGGSIEVVEDGAAWRVTNIIDPQQNVVSLYNALNALLLEDLVDVSILSHSTDDILAYVGTAWTNVPILTYIQQRVHNYVKSQWLGYDDANILYVGQTVPNVVPSGAPVGFSAYIKDTGNIYRLPLVIKNGTVSNQLNNIYLSDGVPPHPIIQPTNGNEITVIIDYTSIDSGTDYSSRAYIGVTGNIDGNFTDIDHTDPSNNVMPAFKLYTEGAEFGGSVNKSFLSSNDTLKLVYWNNKWRILSWNGNINRRVSELINRVENYHNDYIKFKKTFIKKDTDFSPF